MVFQYHQEIVVFDSYEEANECMTKFKDIFARYDDEIVTVRDIEGLNPFANYRNTDLVKPNTTIKYIVGHSLDKTNHSLRLQDIQIIESSRLTEFQELIIKYWDLTNNRNGLPYVIGTIDDNNIEIFIPSFDDPELYE